MAAPVLRDPSGRLTIGGQPTTDYEVRLLGQGATHILTGPQGGFRGVYVDNETPSRDQIAVQLRGDIGAGALVVVGLYPSEAGHQIMEGIICALEWYPVGAGYWGTPLPKAEAYITQWAFAYPGKRPPTAQQRQALYDEARAHRPMLAWVY